jgi:pimeloyl-ACP methyl ester carboxylesterase
MPFDALPPEPRRAHVYFQTEAREVELDSRPFGKMRVHVREHGAGPPLLLVHGLMTTSYSWRYVMGELGRDFRVIAPDLLGAGRTDKPRATYSAEAIATWIGELSEALGIRGCDAIGNSLGGYFCMRLALRDQGAFRRLIDIHSPGVPELRLRLLHALLAPGFVRAGLARWVRRKPERFAHMNVHYFDESLKSLEEAREYGAPLATPDGACAFADYLGDALAPSALAAFVAELEVRRDAGRGFPIPLLLVYARQDPMVPPRVGERLAALIPDSKIVWLDESSHFSHVDTPERIVELSRDFFR